MPTTLIINTPLFKLRNDEYSEDSLPPIGLGYLATALKEKSIPVELIDAVAQNISIKELVSIITAKKPDAVCLNVFSTNYSLVKCLVESVEIKVRFIIGGLSTRALFQSICDWETQNYIDVVLGDGELIIADLIANRVKEKPILEKKSPGRRVYKVDNSSCYFPNDISNIALDRSFFENEPRKHHLGFTEAYIITSRGCSNNCSFCSAARSLNHDFPIREKTATSIVDELHHILSIYPALESIRVLDDLFLRNSNALHKAIQIFKKLPVSWRSMAHVATFKNVEIDVMEKLNDSGCEELFIGLESGSPHILKKIHKVDNISLIKKTIENIFRAGINVKGYFIFGFPGETEDDFRMTYQLACYLKDLSMKYNREFRPSVFQFRPYHGTEIYSEIINQQNKQNHLPLKDIEPNSMLTGLIGRMQFNFYSGNFANASEELLYKYIYLTTNLCLPEPQVSNSGPSVRATPARFVSK